MTAKWNIALSLAAGLLGGVVSHWAFPVSAQAQVTGGGIPSNPPRAIEAQSFALVDASGKVAGTLTMDKADLSPTGPSSLPYLKLTDSNGHEIWSSLSTQ